MIKETEFGDKKACELSLSGVKKTFRMGELTIPVLQGIDMKIHKGELTVILGASGSGKSTLLNLIGGIDRPTSGTILFREKDIVAFNDQALTEYRRRHIGFVFQFYNLVPTLNSRENVQVVTEISENPMNADDVLRLVGLEDRLEHFPSQMSGGQQQRVAIARALAKNPALMLCDEPTGALDAETGVMILKTLTQLNEKLGTTIVIITHASGIAQLAHQVIHIHSGVVSKIERNEKRLKVEEISW